ncbi:MAG: NAD(P)-dependent oxidoreductase [Eubacterium sp.]|nr:NAD(P)-dependent oxidoreductase [Eubacterium sp.]
MILLTGATGFLGSNLLKKLLDDGQEVCCIKRNKSDCRRIEKVKNACVWYDLETEPAERIFQDHKIELVIHCATDYGRNEADYFKVYQTNVFFPLKLLECAVKYGCKYFINTDTFSVKMIDYLWRDSMPLYRDTYHKSKYLFTHIAKDYLDKWDIAFINLQLEHIYGPDDGEGKFVSYVLDNLQKCADQIELTEGKQIRDWIYLDDVVEAYTAVVNQRQKFAKGKFHQLEVGTGVGTSLREFVETAKKVTNSTTKLLFGAKSMQHGELPCSRADNRKLTELGWQPGYNIEDGIRAILKSKNNRRSRGNDL